MIDAQLALRRFSRATNLSIPGRVFVVADDYPGAQQLKRALRAMGARVEAEGATVAFANTPVSGMITVLPDGVVGVSSAAQPETLTGFRHLGQPGAEHSPGFDTLALLRRGQGLNQPRAEILTGFRHLDPATRSQGLNQPDIAWARSHMPVTLAAARRLDLTGIRIGVSLVLEPKTAVLALALAQAGAEVCVFGHAEEVRPVIADALRDAGLRVFADPDPALEPELARSFLATGLHFLLDDGSHLIRLAHQQPGALDQLVGAAEETTSGLRPLREWAAEGRLRTPVIASNDARTKTLFDNAYGTGQSCLMTILDLLDPNHLGWPLPTKTVLIVGYGDVGRGLAKLTAALGGRVQVAELDPVRLLQARMDGHHTGPLDELIGDADLVVSATGMAHTITASHLEALKPGATVAVAGGVDQEVALDDALTRGAHWLAGDKLQRADGVSVAVLAQGTCINVTAGAGNPIEIMDLSFGVQLAALEYLLANPDLPPGVHRLPKEADDAVAEAAGVGGFRGFGGFRHLDPATRGQGLNQPDSTPTRGQGLNQPVGLNQLVQVYSADLVIPITAPSVLGGAVAIRGKRILHVGERDWVLRTLREAGTRFDETRWPGVILPGLVNAHTHLQYSCMAELGRGSYRGFDDWAQAFNQIYDGGNLDWATAAAEGARMSLSHGTTTIADVVTDPAAASALHDAGLHGVAYWEVMDWSEADWASRGQAEVVAALNSMPPTPAVGLSPHAPYSLDAAALLDLPDLARSRGLRLHIHLGESQLEAEWAEGREGALADLWRSEVSTSFTALRASGVGHSATQFVDQLGVLGPDCHVAHGVYMTAEDRRRLRARSTAVALCPRSNRVIGLAAPPVAAYLAEGNLIAVGTDSLSSSPSLDVLGELAELFDLAREQGYEHIDLGRRLLHAATLGGATALGLAVGRHRVGQLQAGAIADLVILDVPVTDVVGTIDDVVRFGAGRQVATLVEGELRWLSPTAG